jgi:hypothetical protein
MATINYRMTANLLLNGMKRAYDGAAQPWAAGQQSRVSGDDQPVFREQAAALRRWSQELKMTEEEWR